MRPKNIVLMHYKTGERDGVSLEIEKRAKILRSLGANVSYITGIDGLQREHVYLIEELNAETGYNRFLREYCFRQKYFDESTLIALYYQLEFRIYKKLYQAFATLQPDMVFVHNMFSHGCNLPATSALIKVLDNYEIPTVAVHHDFWYEREHLQQPQYSFIQAILDVLPPKREYILKQQVINSIACEEMQRRRHLQTETIGDYFDFNQPIPQHDSYNQNLREHLGIQENALLILHATRITGHKVIENAILFVHELDQRLRSLAPIKIAGKVFDKQSEAVLLLPNFVEPEATSYFQTLTSYQKELGVKAIWAADHFLPERQQVNGNPNSPPGRACPELVEGGKGWVNSPPGRGEGWVHDLNDPQQRKIYSFWDSYVVADLVTYTSTQEGFGNQFLEAVYFKKLPVILEYPVFEKDLKQEGYEYVSLGSSRALTAKDGLKLAEPEKILRAVEQTITILQDQERKRKIVEKNFKIAKASHDVSLLKKQLRELIAIGAGESINYFQFL